MQRSSPRERALFSGSTGRLSISPAIAAVDAVGQTLRLVNSGQQDETFFKEMWETISAGQLWQGELINKRKDGSLYTEKMTITPAMDTQGAVTHFVAIKQDITEKRESEIATARLAALVESADEAIISKDLNGIIQSWNPAAEPRPWV